MLALTDRDQRGRCRTIDQQVWPVADAVVESMVSGEQRLNKIILRTGRLGKNLLIANEL